MRPGVGAAPQRSQSEQSLDGQQEWPGRELDMFPGCSPCLLGRSFRIHMPSGSPDLCNQNLPLGADLFMLSGDSDQGREPWTQRF